MNKNHPFPRFQIAMDKIHLLLQNQFVNPSQRAKKGSESRDDVGDKERRSRFWVAQWKLSSAEQWRRTVSPSSPVAGLESPKQAAGEKRSNEETQYVLSHTVDSSVQSDLPNCATSFGNPQAHLTRPLYHRHVLFQRASENYQNQITHSLLRDLSRDKMERMSRARWNWDRR